MRKAIQSNAKKIEKIKQALEQAICDDDLMQLQLALEISVKTRDNSFSMENLLREAQKPTCCYDFFTSDAFYLISEAIQLCAKLDANKCLSYILLRTPHEFKMSQRALRIAITHHNVNALKLLLDYIAKLDDKTYIKHMTTVFMDKGSPLPLPILAAQAVAENKQSEDDKNG
jgi:hypothetical protein